MSKGEHKLIVLWSFVASAVWLISDYREVSAVTFIVAAIVWFYINYALGTSFIFITNGIYGLYKKFKRKEPDYSVTVDVKMDEPITEEKVKAVLEKVQKEQKLKGIRT